MAVLSDITLQVQRERALRQTDAWLNANTRRAAWSRLWNSSRLPKSVG